MDGWRRTSPWTSFHPDSSAASAASASASAALSAAAAEVEPRPGVCPDGARAPEALVLLYFAMSACRVRIMMSATMADRNSTMTRELTMLNQWIWVSVMCRYVSHRLAHRMSEARYTKSWVKYTSSPGTTSWGTSPGPRASSPFSGSQVRSAGSAGSQGPALELRRCLMLNGSTSKPTMRARSGEPASSWYRMVKRRWLLIRYFTSPAVSTPLKPMR